VSPWSGADVKLQVPFAKHVSWLPHHWGNRICSIGAPTSKIDSVPLNRWAEITEVNTAHIRRHQTCKSLKSDNHEGLDLCVLIYNSDPVHSRTQSTALFTNTSLTNLLTNNNEYFQTNAHVHSVSTSTISIKQLLTCHAFRKAYIMLWSKFSIICHVISKVLWMKSHNLK
jgi:hypothetical protein